MREDRDRFAEYTRLRKGGARHVVGLDLHSLTTPDERRLEVIEEAISVAEHILAGIAILKAAPILWAMLKAALGAAPLAAAWPGWLDAIALLALLIYWMVFRLSSYVAASRFLPNVVRRNYDVTDLMGTTDRARLASVQLSPSYRASGYVQIQGYRGFAVYSPAICRALARGADMTIERGGDFVANHVNVFDLKRIAVSRALLKGQTLYNDHLCRLASDLLLEQEHLLGPAVVQRTDYMTLMATDYMAMRQVLQCSAPGTGFSQFVLYDGLSMFTDYADGPDAPPTLRPLGDASDRLEPSVGAGVIGVSALIVTDDLRIFLTEQSTGNVQSGGLIAPSGSGSVDYADLSGLEPPTLLSLAVRAARRETLEEGGLLGGQDGNPALPMLPVGFARMLHVGGKPEFFFVGRAGATAAEIEGRNQHSMRERLFTRRNFGVGRALRVANVAALRDSWRHVKSDLDEQIKSRRSMPLDLAIACVDRVLEDEETAEILRAFLAAPPN